MIICPNCGRKNRDGAEFCLSCGKTLNIKDSPKPKKNKSFEPVYYVPVALRRKKFDWWNQTSTIEKVVFYSLFIIIIFSLSGFFGYLVTGIALITLGLVYFRFKLKWGFNDVGDYRFGVYFIVLGIIIVLLSLHLFK